MKKINVIFIIVSFTSCLHAADCYSQTTKPGASAVLAVFAASTPCSNGTRPLPGISANAGCELIKWNLVLFHNPTTLQPTIFQLNCTYGLPLQGTTGFIGGGTKVSLTGKWVILKGTPANSNAVIYQLNADKSGMTLSFLKLGDDLLHLLDSEKRLMIGNGAWSYTLNKVTSKKM